MFEGKNKYISATNKNAPEINITLQSNADFLKGQNPFYCRLQKYSRPESCASTGTAFIKGPRFNALASRYSEGPVAHDQGATPNLGQWEAASIYLQAPVRLMGLAE